jgi:hypothetical protein
MGGYIYKYVGGYIRVELVLKTLRLIEIKIFTIIVVKKKKIIKKKFITLLIKRSI